MNNNYTPIIGAEIHVELKTKSKMFCPCQNDPFHAGKPNIYTCPVCLGLPGALPVPNKKAIEDCILIGLALNCQVNKESKFDRKHYFYPDLPKGYQISQYDEPFCKGGYVETSQGRVGITRVHMEEDTAKLEHRTVKGKKVSLIDFNRSGVPLVEIVTEPDIRSASQAKEFLKKIRDIIRALGVSDCNMQEGSMRLEANISLSPDGKLPAYKVEVKNINSFRYFANSVGYEIKRHAKLLDAGQTPVQETRGYRDDGKKTVSQRSKEEAQDYRYFPEPDIPPILIDEQWLKEINSRLPELPESKLAKLKELAIPDSSATLIVKDPALYQLVLALHQLNSSLTNRAANDLVNKKVSAKLSAKELVTHYQQAASSTISNQSELEVVIKQVLKANPQVVADYQGGKQNALGFLMGQVMKETQGKANPKLANKILVDMLK